MESKNGQTSIVRGIHHHLKFSNGFQVYGWTSNEIKRAIAIEKLIEIANGEENIYSKQDVESYWKTKS